MKKIEITLSTVILVLIIGAFLIGRITSPPTILYRTYTETVGTVTDVLISQLLCLQYTYGENQQPCALVGIAHNSTLTLTKTVMLHTNPLTEKAWPSPCMTEVLPMINENWLGTRTVGHLWIKSGNNSIITLGAAYNADNGVPSIPNIGNQNSTGFYVSATSDILNAHLYLIVEYDCVP